MGKKSVDVVYVVASKLGSIGMGSAALYALEGIEKSKLSYKVFSRGYNKNINLNKKNLVNYSWLEYISYPFRFLEKSWGIKFNWEKLINDILSKKVEKNLPKCKIYHTWMGISPKAIEKAKKEGAILILEGANSHPSNVADIMNKEYELFKINEKINIKGMKEDSKIYDQFDYVMCPSQFVYGSFLKQGFSKKKLIKMPYGVDTNKFFPIESKGLKRKIKFIFIASIQLRKGIQYLLKAWDELNLKNAELIVVGRVWPDASKAIEKYKNNETIKFVGFNSNTKKVLQQCDVFISPSLEEGSALSCYEAMACGLPLIATYNTGTVVRDKKEGFIIPLRDTKILKEKIKYFYDHPKQIEKMGKSARKQVENYTWEKYGKRLTKEYKKILNKK